MFNLTADDEQRLRALAAGLAKDMEDTDKLLERLGFTREDYNELAETRAFKTVLNQALSEWEGASNTHKRIRLKAATNIEQALPHFFHAMTDDKEPLSSRVKAFEIVARVGNLGNPDVIPPGGGQFFKLEINLGGGRAPLVFDNVTDTLTDIESGVETYSPELPQISRAWTGREREPL
jgi:hypothetical protein